jgi:hypothetical protein
MTKSEISKAKTNNVYFLGGEVRGKKKRNNHIKPFIRPRHTLHREEREHDGSSSDMIEKHVWLLGKA